MTCRGVRGAISVGTDSAGAIIAATQRLLKEMIAANHLNPDDVATVIFTATPDLTTAYPARAARELGWTHVPLLCMQEMAVQGSLPQCIRVLVMWNTDLRPDAIHHVYLGEATKLRPDLVDSASVEEG
ncbi:MAG: chorismate mutase [Chloroflexi bacterium]|nr:chorismate mutase [Chloroflexota bacterium]